MSAASSSTDEALGFLDHMFDANRVRHLVAISEDGKVSARSFRSTDRTAISEWIERRQGEANLYYAVNELKATVTNQKAKKEDVARALHLHVDVDDAGALERIRGFQPKPTAVVFSGGGYQAFWKLREASEDLARVERLNQEIARRLGGDRCHNIDRIMRLPGTINVPNAKKRKAGRVPTLAKVIEEDTDWSTLYSLDDFGDPTPTTPARAAQRSVARVGIDELPPAISADLRMLIEHGDDKGRPVGSLGARFPSRSEVVWAVARELARTGCAIEQIAGILVNPALRISESILEKRRPGEYALRQAQRAHQTVGGEWPDVTRAGRPRPTLSNTILAMRRMGLHFAYDQFRYRKTVQGTQIQDYQGDLSDDACSVLRHAIIEEFGFDP